METEWHYLATHSKDMPGLSESWDVAVACVGYNIFSWGTNDAGDTETMEERDTGDAVHIAAGLIESAAGGEDEMLDALKKLNRTHSQFEGLYDTFKERLWMRAKMLGLPSEKFES